MLEIALNRAAMEAKRNSDPCVDSRGSISTPKRDEEEDAVDDDRGIDDTDVGDVGWVDVVWVEESMAM